MTQILERLSSATFPRTLKRPLGASRRVLKHAASFKTRRRVSGAEPAFQRRNTRP
jgi:hypothetical protein